MCSHCRHRDLNDFENEIRKRFTLDAFGGNKKECLKAMNVRIRELRKEKKLLQRKNQSTYMVDAERRLLSFGSWVLNRNYQEMGGWKDGGWLNVRGSNIHPPPYGFFI